MTVCLLSRFERQQLLYVESGQSQFSARCPECWLFPPLRPKDGHL
jgi:hypothetical protein